MGIGTARPTPEETLGVLHYLMGLVEPDRFLSVADYVALARETTMDTHSRGHLSVLAGGTGLCIHLLVTDTAFTEAGNDPALRAELTQRATQERTEGLMQEFRSSDPESADHIEPRNLS